MKVIFNSHVPFMLAYGGGQIQIEQTKAALEKVGVTVEPLRWWDESQRGDILHHFGRIPTTLLRAAKKKGMMVVFSDLLTEAGSRPRWRLELQRIGQRFFRATLPRSMLEDLSWESYRLADADITVTPWEASLMHKLFGAPAERVHVIPNGVEEVFLRSTPQSRDKWLVCTSTITERKRIQELAEAAVQAATPLWLIGSPYSESDPYARRFVEFARKSSGLIRYEGPIRERSRMAQVYRQARGFVLLSAMESLSLSALEAAACECPLLLSALPWATWTFGGQATYGPASGSISRTAAVLRRFYDDAPNLPVPSKPLSWLEVAQQLKALYEGLSSPHQSRQA